MIELAILTLAIVASIGPTNLFAIKEGVKHGAWSTFFIIFGGVLVDLFYANLAGLGLSALGENIHFKTVLLFVGSLVFIYLGGKGLKIAFQKKMIKAAETKSKAHPLLIGIIMTLPNPYVIIFWATALSGLAIGYKPLTLFAIVIIVGGSWAGIEAGMIHFFRKYIKERLLRVIEAITSIILLGFAIKFLIQFVKLIA